MNTQSDNNPAIRLGFYASLSLAIITLITFGFAMTALPNSGSFCIVDCVEYPYLDTLSEYPGDYLWMPLAMLLLVAYLVHTGSLHSLASERYKIFSRIGLAFAIMAALVLMLCYFIQFSVVPVSLMKGETEGIALLTQYNPHGVFIAMEELGYWMMTFSFLFMAFVFSNKSRIENAIRWIYIIGFVVTVIAFAMISFKYGLDRQYRFEIVIISIDWLVLIINGILTGLVFRRAWK